MDWLLLVFFGIAAIALIIFLAWRNQKDKKDLVNKIKQDYRKSKDEEGDTEIDEVMK